MGSEDAWILTSRTNRTLALHAAEDEQLGSCCREQPPNKRRSHVSLMALVNSSNVAQRAAQLRQ